MLDNAGARAKISVLVDPVAAALTKRGVAPDAVTWAGAIGSIATSALFIAHGHFFLGAIFQGLFACLDLIDGAMARQQSRAGSWGAFLDSTLDRVSDSAVLCALIVWFAHQQSAVLVAVTCLALVTGFLTSYIRARAEAVGVSCKVGFAERAERSLLVWIGMLLAGVGVPILGLTMWVLAAASTVTVGQRMSYVRKQLDA